MVIKFFIWIRCFWGLFIMIVVLCFGFFVGVYFFFTVRRGFVFVDNIRE